MAKKNTPAKPTTVKPTPEKSKDKKGRTEFKLVGHKDEKVYPFQVAMPEGFDFKINKPLKKRDFTADHLFYEYRALEMEFKAVGFRAQAEEAKKLGSAKDRSSAKRLIKLQDKMGELKEQLTKQGVNVEELLANAAKEAAAKKDK